MELAKKNKIKKIVFVIVVSILCLAILGGIVFGICVAYLRRDSITVKFNENETYQTFRYFGATSAWNYRLVGESETDEIKTQLLQKIYGEDGLQISLFRYNIGGGSVEVSDCHYDEACKTESFFDASKYVNKDSFKDVNNYDFTKDAAYMDMFKRSLEIGNIKKVVLFCNSPHYLLTKNNKTHADNEKENNLEEENFEAFSNYVLICSTYIDSVIKSLGYNDIEVYISPVNEPQWKWGGAEATQEGCHYDYDHLAKFYDVFYRVLNEYNTKNNTSFVMDIYESGNYKLGLASSKNKKYFSEFEDHEFFNNIKEISMHSYAADVSKSIRRSFIKYFNKFDKEFIMSEYCVMQGGVDKSVDMGIYSAKVLMEDLNIMNTPEWSWWLSIAFGGWEDGLIYFDRQTKEIYEPYRYYMYGQFMRYIDYGDVRVKADINDPYDLGGVNTVAFKKTDGTIVLVVLNDNNKEKEIKLSSGSFKSAKIIETYKNTYWKERESQDTSAFTVKPKSVTTILLTK